MGCDLLRNPFRRKSVDTLPEGLWEQVVAAGDMGRGAVAPADAVGLPALMAVIRLIAHAAANVPLDVIRGDVDSQRERARDAWQWNLLHERPGPPPMTSANFRADLAAQFCGMGNAYVRKLKPARVSPRLTRESPRVTELLPLDPGKVKPRRADTGAVVFTDSTGSQPVERGTDEIIQIRSFSMSGGLEGLSPITQARIFVTAALRRQQFEERHLANGIAPSVALTFPASMKEPQAKKWLDFIKQEHSGSGKAGKILGLVGGATASPLPISLADAMFAQMTSLTMEQATAMYQVPLAILTPQRRPITDDDWRHFTSFALAPVFTAMASAFEADDDLFKPGEDDDLSVIGDVDALLKLDPLKKAQVQLAQTQSGARLVDEVRNDDGYGPLPPVPEDWTQAPGQVPQITPVGGAPNPIAGTAPQGGGDEGNLS